MIYPKAVIFDLDGTLLDTIEDLTDAMSVVLTRRGYPVRSVEDCKHLVGEGPDEFARGALPSHARRSTLVNKLINEYRAEYANNWNHKTKPYPGIVNLLNELHERGISMAVLSNKRDAMVKKSVSHFLPDIPFVEVRGAQPGVPLKPDVISALLLAEHLGSHPRHLLFVGDTKTDMQTARSAGMVAVGALWGFRAASELWAHGAQHLLEQPGDLTVLLDATLAATQSG